MSTTNYRIKLRAAAMYERGQTPHVVSVCVRKEDPVGFGDWVFEVTWRYADRENLDIRMVVSRFAVASSLEAAYNFTLGALRLGGYSMIDFESIERVEG